MISIPNGKWFRRVDHIWNRHKYRAAGAKDIYETDIEFGQGAGELLLLVGTILFVRCYRRLIL